MTQVPKYHILFDDDRLLRAVQERDVKQVRRLLRKEWDATKRRMKIDFEKSEQLRTEMLLVVAKELGFRMVTKRIDDNGMLISFRLKMAMALDEMVGVELLGRIDESSFDRLLVPTLDFPRPEPA